MHRHPRYSASWIATLGVIAFFSNAARADNFGRVYYDKRTDELVVTMIYRGTNPNHAFSLRWGECQTNQLGDLPGVTVEVLDDQFNDAATTDFRKIKRFSLAGMPCSRPVRLTLRTAPRFFRTLTIPG